MNIRKILANEYVVILADFAIVIIVYVILLLHRKTNKGVYYASSQKQTSRC